MRKLWKTGEVMSNILKIRCLVCDEVKDEEDFHKKGNSYLGRDRRCSSCKKEAGCTDPQAANYNAEAEDDDASCTYSIIATWNLTSFVVNDLDYTSTSLDPHIVTGYWTINSNGTCTLNVVYSDGLVLLDSGTWTLIGTSTFAVTDSDGELENWTIIELGGSGMTITGNIAGAGTATLSFTK